MAHIKLSPSVGLPTTPPTNVHFIEPLLFHAIVSGVPTNSLDPLFLETQRHHLNQLLEGISKMLNRPLTDQEIKCTDSELEMVLDTIRSDSSGNDSSSGSNSSSGYASPTTLQRIIPLLQIISPEYTPQTISQFILSITSPTITSACKSLASLSSIPTCVLVDILTRTPVSKEEYQLQFQIWTDFHRQLVTDFQKLSSSKNFRQCFDQLLINAPEFDPTGGVVDLLQNTLPFHSTGKTDLLTSEYLNSVLWSISYHQMIRKLPFARNAVDSPTGAHELILHHLSAGSNTNSNSSSINSLTLPGYMAIVLGISSISRDKANKLFTIASRKFNHQPQSREHYIVRIFLADTPDVLLYRFNEAAETFGDFATLWHVFVVKLDAFGLLTETRAIKVLEQIVHRGDNILLTKDIMLVLFKPIQSMRSLERLVRILPSKLLQAHRTTTFQKFLRLYYQSGKKKLNHSRHPTLSQLFPPSPGGFYSTWPHKTVSHIGIMLYGEAILQPQNLYKLYLDQLQDGCQPNEECIAALVRAAKVPLDDGECMLWGEMYAPQVAIHEFAKHVMTELEPRSYRIYPSDRLWQNYIAMLSQYDYVSELSLVMKWWERLSFVPSHSTLFQLLLALPEGIAERHIIHVEKVRASGGEGGVAASSKGDMIEWPWPTLTEFQDEKSHRQSR
ncbi:hypothetical protein CAAN1_09S01684 [[Candida] anglica]|uniref:ATPase expression protein 2, mitochondrial n=1 Tax=[Candida] anglica TaxID=148631 RepID=A0ABP0EEZ5_9ASCO